MFDWKRVEDGLEDRNEALGRIYAQNQQGEEPSTTPPPTENPGPDEDEEPEESADQGVLFDLGPPTCPHCGAPVDEPTLQTGVCPNCDEVINPEELIVEKDEPLDDQAEFAFG